MRVITMLVLAAASCAASEYNLTVWPTSGGQVVTGVWPSYEFFPVQLPYIAGGLNSGAIEGFRFCEVGGCQEYDAPSDGYALYLYDGGLVIRSPYGTFPEAQLAEIGRSLTQGTLEGFEWSKGGYGVQPAEVHHDPLPASTPEPATFFMFGSGAMALGWGMSKVKGRVQ